MPKKDKITTALLNRLQTLRIEANMQPEDVERRLGMGPGWITRFETGEIIPSLGVILAILGTLGKSFADLVTDKTARVPAQSIERLIYADTSAAGLIIHFYYDDFDATYQLPNANIKQFNNVLKTLRNGLSRLATSNKNTSKAIKTDSVTKAFLKAVETWPDANPSDLWWYIIYRAYCDPFNHPAEHARLNLSQSWKRTGGWALEEVLVRHYKAFLRKNGIRLFIATSEEKKELLNTIKVKDRLETDKMDVLLTGMYKRKEALFGVVHVKASFAERRTDDVPMSRALVSAGYTSPLWTMDCKSTPAEKPINKGELGVTRGKGKDTRSAKRKDIEDDGFFSACFSYNQRTAPTPNKQKAKSRIYVCNFRNPDDTFSQYIISEWMRFRKK